MQRKKRGSLEWLEFDLLEEFAKVKHGVFLRHGGVSEGPFATLNTVAAHGDDPGHVGLNCSKIRKHLGCGSLISGSQVHGNTVVVVPHQALVECDGYVTREKGVGLAIMHADCQVAIMYDPIHHVCGCIHAGWRGNVVNIYEKAVQKMSQEFSSNPADLLVGISPSLGPCCAEFLNYKTEFPESFWQHQVKPYYFDLWEIGRQQFEAAGVLSHHLEIARICTYCNPLDFYSYRREKPTGRHATVITLEEKDAPQRH
jgi:YfiH family protein